MKRAMIVAYNTADSKSVVHSRRHDVAVRIFRVSVCQDETIGADSTALVLRRTAALVAFNSARGPVLSTDDCFTCQLNFVEVISKK